MVVQNLELGYGDNNDRPAINRPETILGITITFLILAFAGMSLRLYVRSKARLLSWDDAFIVLSMTSMIVGSSILCLMPGYGLGKHFGTLNSWERTEYFKHIWSSNITYCAATTFIKLAILLQYLRLFDMQSRVARTLTLVLIGIVTLWGAAFFFLALFSCRPIAKNWNFALKGECVAWGSKDPDVFFTSWAAHSATNMFFDVLVFILPAPFLKGLRLGGKSRMGLIALFSMGGVVVILSIARLVSLSIKRAGTTPVFDPSFATPTVYVFSVLEVNIAILTASIPIFWPLVTSFAANKILVVNEIEVRTDRRGSAGNALETGGLRGNVAVGVPGLEMDAGGGRTSRMSVSAVGGGLEKETLQLGQVGSTVGNVTAGAAVKPVLHHTTHSSHSRLTRSSSRTTRLAGHRPKTSSSGSVATTGKSIPIELGRRISQESQRGLNSTSATIYGSRTLQHQASSGTLSLTGQGESPDLGRNSGGSAGIGGREYFPAGERAMSPFDPVWGKGS